MNHYLSQLIDDIRKASWNLRPPHDLWVTSEANPDNELELEDMAYVEQYIYGEEEPIGEITGIDQGLLPFPEELTEQEQALLATELEKLLEVFHFILDFPETFPMHLRYPFIRDFWEESHVVLSFGENHIEFCDYTENYCAFPGYCTSCAEIEAQLKFDEASGKSADNFDLAFDKLLPTPEEVASLFNEMGIPEDHETETMSNEDKNAIKPENLSPSGSLNEDLENMIEKELLPVPGLCIVCKNYNQDEDTLVFCNIARLQQRNSQQFACPLFEKDE